MNIVYLDNSATTKPHKEVIDAVACSMEDYFANPSSAHKLGADAEKQIRAGKEKIARLINASWQDLIITSGGSEANNTAVRGIIKKGDHIITTRIEHPSIIRVMESLQEEGVEVSYIDADGSGIISLKQLENSIKENTRLVSIMHVNNEIGSIEPLEEIVRIVRENSKKTKIHIDGIQSAGKIKIDVKKLDIDMMSLSAHKIHGPKGIGALYLKKGLSIKPFIAGGGQERGLRSGTENLPGIAGFGAAADIILCNFDKNIEHVKSMKKHFLERLKELNGVYINSPDDDQHIGNILNVSFEGVRGEVLLHALEDYNIFVSTGSACSSKKGGHENYVLPAIGLKKALIEGTIRFSFSYMNTIEEIDYTIDALKKILLFLRR